MKAGWELKTLGEVCKIARGGSPRPIKNFVTDDPEGINWIRISDTQKGGRFIDHTEQKIRQEGVSRSRFVTSGSFLLSNSMSFGRPYVLRIDGCIHDGWLVLEPDYSTTDQDFLYHVLGSSFVFKQFDKLAAGSTVRNLNKELVSKVSIPLPPLEEQKRIVSILDEAFEGLDRARENAEANLKSARELFANLLNATFESNNEQWTHSNLGAACQFIGGSQPPKANFTSEDGEGLIRLVQIRDYKSDKNITFIPRSLARRFCTANDVMIGRYGPPLFQILRGIEGAYNVALMKAEPNPELLSKDYLYFFLRNGRILKYIIDASNRAAGQIGLNKATIEPYPISYPNLAEQSRIVAELEKAEIHCKSLETKYRTKLQDISDLRQSLLKKAFAGELT